VLGLLAAERLDHGGHLGAQVAQLLEERGGGNSAKRGGGAKDDADEEDADDLIAVGLIHVQQGVRAEFFIELRGA
jgi:hypothetical protein